MSLTVVQPYPNTTKRALAYLLYGSCNPNIHLFNIL